MMYSFLQVFLVKCCIHFPFTPWEDNIKIHLGEIGWEVVGWIHLLQGRDKGRVLVSTAVNLRVP
jgi:hypothetical protein